LQIKWATATLWQKAVETVLEAANISLLRKLDHFLAERFGVAGNHLFDQSGGTIFRPRGSPGISGLEGTTADLRPLVSYPRSGVTRSYWFHQERTRSPSGHFLIILITHFFRSFSGKHWTQSADALIRRLHPRAARDRC